MFHAVGVTPEAPTLDAATGGGELLETIAVTPEMVITARDTLSSASDGPVSMVALGTPHFSLTEFERAAALNTCTYFAPAVRAARGRVMTNSAKWAYYAPGLLPVEVAFGSLEDCIETAIRGEVTRRDAVWSDFAWGL
jgi:predicted aconitase